MQHHCMERTCGKEGWIFRKMWANVTSIITLLIFAFPPTYMLTSKGILLRWISVRVGIINWECLVKDTTYLLICGPV